ncbi:MAG: hypothetical protein AAEJ04_07990 [Planctomycetota bacterium]
MIPWLFQSSWKRSAVALLLLLALIVLLLGGYLKEVESANSRRVATFLQQLGVDDAAGLWALSVSQRDPSLFPLRDYSWLPQFIATHGETDVVSSQQRSELLELIRQSDLFVPARIVTLEYSAKLISQAFNLFRKKGLVEDSDVSIDLQQDLSRWHDGVELMESMLGGRVLIGELMRLNILEKILNRSHEWLNLDAPELARILETLARVQRPQASMARAIHIETLVQIEAFTDLFKQSAGSPSELPWSLLPSLDFQFFLDHTLRKNIDPFTPENLAWANHQGVLDPPFYAVISKMLMIPTVSMTSRATAGEDLLQLTRAAFECVLARKQGLEWQLPAGMSWVKDSKNVLQVVRAEGASGVLIAIPE